MSGPLTHRPFAGLGWRGKNYLTEPEAAEQEAAGEYPGTCGLCGGDGHRLQRCSLGDVLWPVLHDELDGYVPPGRIREHHERI